MLKIRVSLLFSITQVFYSYLVLFTLTFSFPFWIFNFYKVEVVLDCIFIFFLEGLHPVWMFPIFRFYFHPSHPSFSVYLLVTFSGLWLVLLKTFLCRVVIYPSFIWVMRNGWCQWRMDFIWNDTELTFCPLTKNVYDKFLYILGYLIYKKGLIHNKLIFQDNILVFQDNVPKLYKISYEVWMTLFGCMWYTKSELET